MTSLIEILTESYAKLYLRYKENPSVELQEVNPNRESGANGNKSML